MIHLRLPDNLAQLVSCARFRDDAGGAEVALLDATRLCGAGWRGLIAPAEEWLAGAAAPAAGLLEPDEAARLARFLPTEKRLEFLLGRVLLRGVLEPLCGGAAPRLRAAGDGKLHLAGCAGGPFFNLSHSKGVLVAIVSADREVGIDVERIRPFSEELARSTMHPDERAAIRAPEDFFRLWTAKEAVMKLRGAGLKIAPLRLRADLGAGTVTDLRTGERATFRWLGHGDHVASWTVA